MPIKCECGLKRSAAYFTDRGHGWFSSKCANEKCGLAIEGDYGDPGERVEERNLTVRE